MASTQRSADRGTHAGPVCRVPAFVSSGDERTSVQVEEALRLAADMVHIGLWVFQRVERVRRGIAADTA